MYHLGVVIKSLFLKPYDKAYGKTEAACKKTMANHMMLSMAAAA